jgi:acyl-CoA synthetase (AMP-forming)/AMP-acid ligase II/acyl carrier protein
LPRPSIAHGGELEPSGQPPSLAAGLLQSSTEFPGGGVTYLSFPGQPVCRSYSYTLQRARRILGGLQKLGMVPGDKIVLHFRNCENFVPALWATLLGGIIPVPVGKHDWNQHHAGSARENLAQIGHLLGSAILTDVPVNGPDGLEPDEALERQIALDSIEADSLGQIYYDAKLDAPALFILTSGATGQRRLVMLSARAIINRWWPNMPAAQEASAFLSWLPFDHVMGMGIAGPNLPAKIYLPTGQFVASPGFWLDAVMQFRVTHSTMTNFGMSLIERYVESAPDRHWDLSSIHKIGIGAEAISPELCRRFFSVLQPFGLRADALILGYGLTECGPVVGGSRHFPVGRAAEDPFPVLDGPTRGHKVRIVDSDGHVVPEGVTGEVRVNGPTMALGYFEENGATNGLLTSDGWIKTGDLGLLQEGCLTITGREKEVIIIHARNYACIEIEKVAQSVPGIEATYAVASNGTASGNACTAATSQFALFFVPAADAALSLAVMASALRARIGERYGVAPAFLIPVWDSDIPRTPSGKVQRLQLASRLEAGEFRRNIASLQSLISGERELTGPSNAQEQTIFSLWTKILGTDKFGVHDDFFDAGGDSLSAIRMVCELECALKRPVPIAVLLECTTVASLAAFLGDGLSLRTESEP